MRAAPAVAPIVTLGEVLLAWKAENPCAWSLYRPTPWKLMVWVPNRSDSGAWHTYWLSSRVRARSLQLALECAGFEARLGKE